MEIIVTVILAGTTAELVQEPRRDLRSPNRQRLIPGRPIPNRSLLINQITICIVFHHITSGIPPVVKDLGA